MSICYEVLFPELARQQAQAGAELLVNLSNESWLGAETNGPDHMLAAAILRTVETGLPMLRATTTGRTVAIDATGRVLAHLPPREPGRLVVDYVPGLSLATPRRLPPPDAWMIVCAILAVALRLQVGRARPTRS